MAQEARTDEAYTDWGDYVSEDEEDDIADEATSEGVNAYSGTPAPCYPVTVGEIIQGGGKSYRIEHKLGRGTFSLVWLAFEMGTSVSVALKIHNRSRSQPTESGASIPGHLIESGVRQDLRQSISDPARCSLLTDFSTFTLPGRFPGDTHVVVVLPLMGPNLREYLDSPVELDSSTRLRLAKDCLTAVACLHAHEYVHRDLNDRNIMLGLVPGALDQGPTPSERYKQIGRPQKVALPTGDFIWRSGDLVAPVGWLKRFTWPSHMVAKSAFLGDFGLTKHASSPLLDDCLAPLAFCAPELFHDGFEPTYSSDTWSFMCIFTALMTCHSPFSGWGQSGNVSWMTRRLGPLPREWEGRYLWPDHYPDEVRRTWYHQPKGEEDGLALYLDGARPELAGSRERELILEVMRKGFRYKPEERITAQELLVDTAFLELISIYGIN